ncbi:MAG: fibronectin type III domain-containing protein [Thaumarchaeota archaeon]|nr:fibronectin type III domain-containing protein [Nitrososphaerota archaeon]
MKEQLNRIIAGLIALLVISSPMLVAMPHAAFASSSSQTGIMIPLYTYPTDSSWTTVINVKNAHPNVPMIVIADVSGSGAGTSIDSNFLQGINNLKAAGITVLGYDDTAYGSRAVSQVETEASNWYNWYHVNGIFFDEMNNVPGGESYYSNLSSYVKSLGMTMTVGNPGTTTLTSYVGTVDNIVIYESTGLPSLSLLLSSVFNGIYAKSDFSFISYSVSSMPSSSYLSSASNDVEYLYITNAGGSNPYDVLPSYFSTEVADLDTGSTTSTSPSAPTGLTAAAGNAQISLSWTVPSSNGGSAITGYNVYRGTTSGGENTTPIATGVTTTTYTDTGLINGQAYYYTVKAVNAIGVSSNSNEASAIPVASTAVPSTPTGLSATAASSSQINLSWTAPSNNGGSAITGYEIQRSTNGGSTWSTIVPNTGTTGTIYSDTGLSSSTTYTYQVSAINSVGTSSPSNTASATTNSSGGSTSSSIVLNNVQSTSGTISGSPYKISLSNFNVGTSIDRLLVVGVSADNSNVASVTFGGISLTKAVSSFNNNDAEFWYLKNPTGTGNVVVTMSGSTSAVIGAYAFSGVNQTQPIPAHVVKHNTSASSPAISITTKYPNDWVLDLPSIYGGVTLGSPSCTQEWNVNMPNAITGASSTSVVSSPTAYTCNWIASGGGDLWDDAAIEVRTISP